MTKSQFPAWQPIESAPKNGSMLFRGHGLTIKSREMSDGDEYWIESAWGWMPLLQAHMPLPEPPE